MFLFSVRKCLALNEQIFSVFPVSDPTFCFQINSLFQVLDFKDPMFYFWWTNLISVFVSKDPMSGLQWTAFFVWFQWANQFIFFSRSNVLLAMNLSFVFVFLNFSEPICPMFLLAMARRFDKPMISLFLCVQRAAVLLSMNVYFHCFYFL